MQAVLLGRLDFSFLMAAARCFFSVSLSSAESTSASPSTNVLLTRFFDISILVKARSPTMNLE